MSLPSDRMRELYEARAEAEYAAPKPLPDPRLDRKFARIRELIREQLPCESFLDAGCGDGRYFAALAGELPERVAGVDISERILETARLQAPAGAELRQANLESLPFPDSAFDLVLSTQVIEHVLDPPRAAAELARVLRPGGRLVISTDNERNRISQALNLPRTALVRALRLTHRRSPLHSPATPFGVGSFRALLEGAGLEVERVETFRFHLQWPLDFAAVQRGFNRVDERLPAHGWGDVLAAVARKP
ncbi:MAG TPA: methyltransferase domain-containing protein [Gaiellaceae bacterium]|nr:methyltransferase domain-containing protein [Gaiellaceae bacterium]